VRAVRVLIVEPSVTVCAVLRRILSLQPGIEVAAEVADAEGAIRLAEELQPDAIVIDADLPDQGGFTAVEEITKRRPTPIVAVASRLRQEQMADQFRSLSRGGIGVLAKPEVPAEWDELGRILPETILQMGSLRATQEADEARSAPKISGHSVSYIAVGASTGGPGALCQMLRELGPRFPVGVAVVQHIAAGFEQGLATWLSHELGIDVRLAADGEELLPGRVRLAEAGSHLRIDSSLRLRLDTTVAPIRGHRPSANELFNSFCDVCPTRVAAVLLTGMGDDGVDGLLALRKAGALTVTQDESTSVVYGMPRIALARRAAEIVLSPREIGRMLAQLWQEERR
jgi:two-component system chemotaxis response regulator CheB